MRTLIMYDATPGGVADIPSNAKAVAGYVDGNFQSFGMLAHRFYPRAHCVSIGVDVGTLAEFADVETGNAINTPERVRESFLLRKSKGVWRPGFYGDRGHMEAVILPGLSGIPRNEYRLWLADWDGIATVPAGYEAKQFTNNRRASGAEGPYDSSVVNVDAFFPAAKKRIPRPKPLHPKVVGFTGIGGLSTALITLLHNQAHWHVTTAEAGAIVTVAGLITGYIVPSPKNK